MQVFYYSAIPARCGARQTVFSLGSNRAKAKESSLRLIFPMEVQLCDGTHRRFGAGSMLLAEDLTGSGHATKVVRTDSWRCAYVPFDGMVNW